MHRYLSSAALCILLPLAAVCVEAHAAPNKARPDLFGDLQSLTGDLSRYNYLIMALASPLLTPTDQALARQLLASCESELGLYSEAVRDFPQRTNLPRKLTLPETDAWKTADAVDTIVGLVGNRRIVMVNEAHHDGHTRELTLLLLPRLRAMGFTHFAAEALGEEDPALMERGYPVASSGSEYLHDPLYGEIVREAIKLGYIIVPYDAAGGTPQDRENDQARNLYERSLAGNPHAKLFVHAGYAHVDKQPGRLGSIKPMAMQLRNLTGIVPLSIDQTDIREENPASEVLAHREARHAVQKVEAITQTAWLPLGLEDPGDTPDRPGTSAYARIVAMFHIARPVVLLRIDNHTPWSARPGVYDLNVILPPANPVPSSYSQGPLWLSINGERHAVLPPANRGHRPDWLTLDGQRVTVPVDSRYCAKKFPCLVEAHYAAESTDAIAADRYLFLKNMKNVLYLRPGAYRLRTVDDDGQTLNEHAILVSRH